MSSVWLHWLATWFRPVFDTLQHMVADLYLFPICLTVALAVGAFHIVATTTEGTVESDAVHTGHRRTRMTVTRPHLRTASDNGMLTQARNLGLTVSSAALNGGIAPVTAPPR